MIDLFRSQSASPAWTPARSLSWLAPLLLLALVLPGCDNPSCVFGGDCSGSGGSGGGLGSEAASFPMEGSYVESNIPTLVRVVPSGPGVHPQTVIFVEFNESVDAGSLNGAIELVDLGFQQPLPLGPAILAAEGRVAIFLPSMDLTPGRQYEVRYSEEATIIDLNGQTVNAPPGQRLSEFTTALDPSPTPTIMTTFPQDGDEGASDLGSIVVVFDRAMDEDTIDNDTFQVRVDGEEPEFNPSAEPLSITVGGTPIPIPQVAVWRSTVDDLPVSLGTGLDVRLTLSPGTSPIFPEDEEGEALETTFVNFQLANIAAPVAVFKEPLAPPEDAIGGGNLADPEAPVVVVQLTEAPGNNQHLGVYLFGFSTDEVPVLRSLYRNINIEGETDVIQLSEDDLDLLDSDGNPRFAEGTIEIAVQTRRSDQASGVRRFDSDLSSLEPQRPVFDVTPPTLLGFGTEGVDLTGLLVDTRDLSIVGRADEEIAFALVESGEGDNTGDEDGPPPVAGGSSSGLFVTRPVSIEALDPNTAVDFTVTLYDRAQNPAPAITGVTYRQRGLVEGGGLSDSQPIAVRVVDESSLAPLSGALVMVQGETAGTFTTITSLTSGTDGTVSVPAAVGESTVITVQLEGYDLFTFSGVTGPALDVLLSVSDVEAAQTGGVVLADLLTGVVINEATNLIGESRLRPPGDPLLGVGSCGIDQTVGSFACDFGPFPIVPGRLGAQTLLSTAPVTSSLLAFSLRYPVLPIGAGVAESVQIEVDGLLGSGDEEDQAIAVDPAAVIAPAEASFGTLDSLEVTIEAVTAALKGTLPIGLGGGLETVGIWAVTGFYPGVADGIMEDEDDELGDLVVSGTFQDALHLRMEFVDEDGNRAGIRPRLDSPTLDTQPLLSTEVPALRAPVAGSTTGGADYPLEFDDVLPDAYGVEGLYRVTLTGSNGQRWVLWRTDAAGGGGGATLTLNVPPIVDLGGTPLPSGAVSAEVAAFSWPDLDLASGRILWSDVEREFERFGFTVPVEFDQP